MAGSCSRDQLKDRLLVEVDKLRPLMVRISRQLYERPELGLEEFESCRLLTTTLAHHGFAVETNLAGMATAFRATVRGRLGGTVPPPTVALMAEYDALPGIGHGCGHNLIAAMASGAAIALARLADCFRGVVAVFGTPAEEGSVKGAGGKAILARGGFFDGVDVAMMVHPSGRTLIQTSSSAREALEVSFHGRAAHAAGAPHHGINALEALIQSFNNWNALRQQLPPHTRIHGIITHGGVAANIIPEFAQARVYVRAPNSRDLSAAVARVAECARGAAQALGARVEIAATAETYQHLIVNVSLARAFQQNLAALGIAAADSGRQGVGSTDMGNVSHLVPSIHPYISICDPAIPGHTSEFARATLSRKGKAAMIAGAKALAATAFDVFSDAVLLQEVREEFQRVMRSEQSAD